ncbi:MAG TPA: hypothetical protein VGB11_05855, partial [Candidatus Bathyarchaeia archaeon]
MHKLRGKQHTAMAIIVWAVGRRLCLNAMAAFMHVTEQRHDSLAQQLALRRQTRSLHNAITERRQKHGKNAP